MPSLFVDHGLILYGIPDYVLMDIGIQLITKFFEMPCPFLETKHVTTTFYQGQK